MGKPFYDVENVPLTQFFILFSRMWIIYFRFWSYTCILLSTLSTQMNLKKLG